MELSYILSVVAVTWLCTFAEIELYSKESKLTIYKLYLSYSVELERLIPKFKWKNKWANDSPDIYEEEKGSGACLASQTSIM